MSDDHIDRVPTDALLRAQSVPDCGWRMIKRIFVDTETSGLTTKHAIVQLAAIIEIDDRVHRFSIECAPCADDLIDDEALAVSGRKADEIRGYMPAWQAHRMFVSFLSPHVNRFNASDKFHLLAYNASFDADMIRAWFRKAGDTFYGAWFWSAPIDIMTVASEKLLDVRHEMPSFKLAAVCERLGIALPNAHDARADVEAARQVYWACRQQQQYGLRMAVGT